KLIKIIVQINPADLGFNRFFRKQGIRHPVLNEEVAFHPGEDIPQEKLRHHIIFNEILIGKPGFGKNQPLLFGLQGTDSHNGRTHQTCIEESQKCIQTQTKDILKKLKPNDAEQENEMDQPNQTQPNAEVNG